MKKNASPEIIGLNYTSRSGSTYLSRVISKYYTNSILVLPETRIVPQLFLIGDKNIEIINKGEVNKIVSSDYQLENLKLTQIEAENIIYDNRCKGISNILLLLSKNIYANKKASYIIVKHGKLATDSRLTKSVKNLHKMIHIVRDPRSVANSQIHNYKPYRPCEKMGLGDALYCSYIYKRQLKSIDSSFNNITMVYENFGHQGYINNTLEQWLNIKQDKILSGSFEVNKKEEQLHPSINKPFNEKRINIWKDGLKKWQIFIIESTLSNEMKKYGYNFMILDKTNILLKIIYYLLGLTVFIKNVSIVLFCRIKA